MGGGNQQRQHKNLHLHKQDGSGNAGVAPAQNRTQERVEQQNVVRP
jgi:hypothetical protein